LYGLRSRWVDFAGGRATQVDADLRALERSCGRLEASELQGFSLFSARTLKYLNFLNAHTIEQHCGPENQLSPIAREQAVLKNLYSRRKPAASAKHPKMSLQGYVNSKLPFPLLLEANMVLQSLQPILTAG
jgi:hypothetical protein